MARAVACGMTVLFVACGIGHVAAADFRWHWDDRFTAPEQATLSDWIEGVVAATETAVTPYPFPIHVHFVRAGPGSDPVPFASTIRSQRQGVRIRVDPGHSLSMLRADWTAWHEMAHLFLPYLGPENAWFAEGFASFMQYQLMADAGVLTRPAIDQQYRERIARARARFDLTTETLVAAAPTLRRRGDFPTLYWGGAVYFLRVDAALRARGRTLADVVAGYVRCCRRDRDTLDALVSALDEAAEGREFSAELARFRSTPGFPAYPASAGPSSRTNSGSK